MKRCPNKNVDARREGIVDFEGSPSSAKQNVSHALPQFFSVLNGFP
jgi:hypothetical protein